MMVERNLSSQWQNLLSKRLLSPREAQKALDLRQLEVLNVYQLATSPPLTLIIDVYPRSFLLSYLIIFSGWSLITFAFGRNHKERLGDTPERELARAPQAPLASHEQCRRRLHRCAHLAKPVAAETSAVQRRRLQRLQDDFCAREESTHSDKRLSPLYLRSMIVSPAI